MQKQIRITAEATLDGSRFVGWSDGITTNPRIVTVNSDMMLTANYEVATGLNEVKTETKAIKYFDNGHVIILTPDGQMYQTSGRRIK